MYKESSASVPFLFTIYMLKCVLLTVGRTLVLSMCRNLSGNTVENDGNTKKHALKISPRFIALCGGIFQSLSLYNILDRNIYT